MRKNKLSLFLLLLCAIPAFGQSYSTASVDLLMPMNTSTPGTQLSVAIVNAGTVSSTCVVGSTCTFATPLTGDLVGANPNACSNLGPVQMNGGGVYPAQSLNY